MLRIKRNDDVIVIAGKEKGKRGKVLRVIQEKGRVLVEGVNKVKRHTKPSRGFPEGGIIDKESALDVSNVMLFCSHCNKGARYRSNLTQDGRKVRVCVHCGTAL